MAIDAKAGQNITVVDIEGGQVVDFFAESAETPNEFLSTGVTIDCNESLKLQAGDMVYTNLYRPMFEVTYDEVGEHDLLHPCCRPEMYDFFYHNGDGHPNCLDNINGALGEKRPMICPVNLFMYTEILDDGRIAVIAFRKKDFEETGTTTADTDGVIDPVIAIAGVEVAFSIAEVADKSFKISIRTSGGADASDIAAVFGGGGHSRAAGCRLNGYYEDIVDKLMKAARDRL